MEDRRWDREDDRHRWRTNLGIVSDPLPLPNVRNSWKRDSPLSRLLNASNSTVPGSAGCFQISTRPVARIVTSIHQPGSNCDVRNPRRAEPGMRGDCCSRPLPIVNRLMPGTLKPCGMTIDVPVAAADIVGQEADERMAEQ